MHKKYYFEFGVTSKTWAPSHIVAADTYEEACRLMVKKLGLDWARRFRAGEEAGVYRYDFEERNEFYILYCIL